MPTENIITEYHKNTLNLGR